MDLSKKNKELVMENCWNMDGIKDRSLLSNIRKTDYDIKNNMATKSVYNSFEFLS